LFEGRHPVFVESSKSGSFPSRNALWRRRILIALRCLHGRAYAPAKHLVWESQADLDASPALDDDPVVAEPFACFDSDAVAYACCERSEPGGDERRSGVAPV
jgi:hypothetical protein